MSLPPPAQDAERVFVNASLRFGSIDAIGFDMDYTLAPYDSEQLERLAFGMALASLIEMGYPDPVGRLEYRPGYAVRGLVVDKDRGNVLKMDRYRFVSMAYHGDQQLTTQARRDLYSNQSIPLGAGRYTSVDTLFHMPEVDLFTQLVSLKDEHPDLFGPRNYSMLWSDVRRAIDVCHGDGRLKERILADLGRFLDPDPDLPAALAALRSMGKKLFVLTNSELYYTDAVMAYLFDGQHPDFPRWTDYFDEVVVEARKPGYFLEVEEGQVAKVVETVDGRSLDLVEGGNYRELHRRLGCGGDQVLFVGDHIYGDVIRSKTHSFWRTFMVVPELEHELEVAASLEDAVTAYLERFRELQVVDGERTCLRRELAELEPSGAEPGRERAAMARRLAAMDARAAAMREEVRAAERQLDRRFHPRWGSVMQDGGEVSRFGNQVCNYADLYASRVSNLARYPGDKWFHCPWTRLPHMAPERPPGAR